MDEVRIVTNSKSGTQLCSLFLLCTNCLPCAAQNFALSWFCTEMCPLLTITFRHYHQWRKPRPSVIKFKVHKILFLIRSSRYYFLCRTDYHVGQLHCFINVFGEALALTTVTTYHPLLSPQTLLLSYKECFQERNPNGQKVNVAYRSSTDDKCQ